MGISEYPNIEDWYKWKRHDLFFIWHMCVNMHKPPTGFNHVSDAEPGIQLTEVAAMKVLSSNCISRDRFWMVLDKFPTMMHHDFVFKIESKNLLLFSKTLAFLHRTPTNAAAPFTKKKGKTSRSSHTIEKKMNKESNCRVYSRELPLLKPHKLCLWPSYTAQLQGRQRHCDLPGCEVSPKSTSEEHLESLWHSMRSWFIQ